MSHQNVAATYDVGEWNGAPYIACEFVTGEPLRAAIGGRRMHPRRAVDIAAQIADALAEAHTAGIVHSDLAVDNVVMTPHSANDMMGWRTESAKDVMTTLAALVAGEQRNPVDPQRGY